MVFFPSYKMMDDLNPYINECLYENGYSVNVNKEYTNNDNHKICIYPQSASMGEQEREDFLSKFMDNPGYTTAGLCVMGGIFGEGIDLKGTRLIGAVIVGTGLPMVCTENELFLEYFEENKGSGFNYAYSCQFWKL